MQPTSKILNQRQDKMHLIEQINIINSALAQAHDEQAVLETIARYAFQYGAQSIALMAIHTDEAGQPHEVSYVAQVHTSSSPVRLTIGQSRPMETTEIELITSDNLPVVTPIYSEDYAADERLDKTYREAGLALGIQAGITLPLRDADQWQALLVVYWTQPHQFNADERNVYSAIIPIAASVVARHRAYRETKASEKATATLYRLAESINAATTYQETMEAVAGVFPECDGIYLNLWQHFDYDRAEYVEIAAAASNLRQIDHIVGQRFAKTDLPFAAESPEDRMVVMENVATEPTLDAPARESYEALGTRASIRVPFFREKHLVGAVFFQYNQPRTFTQPERRLAMGVGDLVLSAVIRIQALHELADAALAQRAAFLAEQEAREEISLLYKASEAVNAANTMQEIINAIAPLARDMEMIYLVLWDHLDYRKADYFHLLAGITNRGEIPSGVGHKFTEAQFPIVEKVKNLRQIVIEDIYDHPLVDPVTRAGWAADGVGAMLVVNLVQDERWYGMLTFENRTPRRYSERDRRLTLTISDLVLSAAVRIQARYELATALQAEQEARQEIAALYRVSKAINQASNMEEVLAATKPLFPDPVDVAIFAWEGYDRTQATYLESLASTDPHIRCGQHLPREVVMGPATLDPTQILVANNVNSPEWATHPATDSARLFGLYSIAYTNLINNYRIQGVLAIASYAPYTFKPEEIRLLSAIAGLTAAALERIRSRRAEEEARQESEVLFQASQAINAANSFQDILKAVEPMAFDNGDFYLYIFENFDSRTATYIETMATGEDRFMQAGTRIPLDQLPFLKKHHQRGLSAYEDVPNNPQLDEVTRATMIAQGTLSNLRFGLFWSNRFLGAFGIDHATARAYSARERRMMAALGDLVSAAVERIRLQLESNAARERAERLAEQAQQLAALEERTRLARELHDSVSQALYGIGLGAQTARRSLDKDPAMVRESVDYVLALTEAGLAEMRALIFELRPESLENEGLVVALSKQAASLQARHGIKMLLELRDEPPLSLAAKESLYRVVREALHNVVKHAGATQITLRMCREEDALRLEVLDNGVGFKTAQEFPGHLGLHSMHERVTHLGGKLDIESAPGKGTHLTLALPLPKRGV